MDQIVVGVDGSPTSAKAFAWAADLAEETGAALRAVMSWEDRYSDMWVPGSGVVVDRLAVVRRALEHAALPVTGAHPTLPVELTAVEGPPARRLVAAAEDADVLVVGSRGHGGLTGTLLGSVSLFCVTHAPCPVVVFRGSPRAHMVADAEETAL
ncbi:MAG: universal stress protein [Acidimicrobiales bacterium]